MCFKIDDTMMAYLGRNSCCLQYLIFNKQHGCVDGVSVLLYCRQHNGMDSDSFFW
jgi:hypothetical protein